MNSEYFMNPTSSYTVGTQLTADTELGTYERVTGDKLITMLKTVGDMSVCVQDGKQLIVTLPNLRITTQCSCEIQSIDVSTDYVAVIYTDGFLEVFSIQTMEKKVRCDS